MKTNTPFFMLNYCEICGCWRKQSDINETWRQTRKRTQKQKKKNLHDCICSFAHDISARTSSRSLINECLRSWTGKHMPFAPSDKHIKSSSQEKGTLLAAVASTQSQGEPEDKTMEDNGRRRERNETSLDAGNGCNKTGSQIWMRWSTDQALFGALSSQIPCEHMTAWNKPKTVDSMSEMQIHYNRGGGSKSLPVSGPARHFQDSTSL